MNNKKMTRAEFCEAYVSSAPRTDDLWKQAAAAADIAEHAGVEWLPEPVDPVVGELLTEDTRLAKYLGVVLDTNAIYQCIDLEEGRWVGLHTYLRTADLIRRSARIVFVPGDDSE